MLREIKSCPFCGGLAQTAIRITRMGGDRNTIEFSVYCVECRVQKWALLNFEDEASFADVEMAMERALEKWKQESRRCLTEKRRSKISAP